MVYTFHHLFLTGSSKGRPKNEKEKNEQPTRELRDDDKNRDNPNNKPPRKRLRVNRNKRCVTVALGVVVMYHVCVV